MVVGLATALDEFSTSLRRESVRLQHNSAKAIESVWLPVVVVVSCAFAFAAVVLSMQIHFRVFPVKAERKIQ